MSSKSRNTVKAMYNNDFWRNYNFINQITPAYTISDGIWCIYVYIKYFLKTEPWWLSWLAGFIIRSTLKVEGSNPGLSVSHFSWKINWQCTCFWVRVCMCRHCFICSCAQTWIFAVRLKIVCMHMRHICKVVSHVPGLKPRTFRVSSWLVITEMPVLTWIQACKMFSQWKLLYGTLELSRHVLWLT